MALSLKDKASVFVLEDCEFEYRRDLQTAKFLWRLLTNLGLCKKKFSVYSLETLYKGDIVVRDTKQQRSIFHHYKISDFCVTVKFEIL